MEREARMMLRQVTWGGLWAADSAVWDFFHLWMEDFWRVLSSQVLGEDGEKQVLFHPPAWGHGLAWASLLWDLGCIASCDIFDLNFLRSDPGSGGHWSPGEVRTRAWTSGRQRKGELTDHGGRQDGGVQRRKPFWTIPKIEPEEWGGWVHVLLESEQNRRGCPGSSWRAAWWSHPANSRNWSLKTSQVREFSIWVPVITPDTPLGFREPVPSAGLGQRSRKRSSGSGP